VQLFLDQEITRIAKDYGPNEVVIRREIAPGQTVEFFVEMEGNNYRLVPLGDGDRAENATIIIEEYNPQQVKMNVLVLPDSNKDKPMYLFKKKKGGIMPDDRLVSITDIYGDY
jgi:bifunctional DNA-binding transcriptional regulator/antitoxin component of YhaV-PrlF toxin-antitoxin module